MSQKKGRRNRPGEPEGPGLFDQLMATPQVGPAESPAVEGKAAPGAVAGGEAISPEPPAAAPASKDNGADGNRPDGRSSDGQASGGGVSETSSTARPRVASSGPSWTPAQLAAITHVGGDLLVSAAAGSGKTAVLAERCARLVTEGHTQVDRLLVLTFTEAAANEMRTRIAAALRGKIAQLGGGGGEVGGLHRQAAMLERASISTLHAFCARTLRNFFHDAGIDPAFEIIDEDETRLLREEILAETLAEWHRRTNPGAPAAEGAVAAFPAFYESHAEGSDAHLAGFVRKLYDMLATVKDPEGWLEAARGVYSEAGAPGTRAAYIREVVARDMELLLVRCRRHKARLAECGYGTLTGLLDGLGRLLETVVSELQADPAGAWDRSAEKFRTFGWPDRVMGPRGDDRYRKLKEDLFDSIRDDHKKHCRTTFAPRQTAAQLLADLRSLAGPLEVLIALTLDFQRAFAEAKRQQNRLDFADLERFTLDLLTRPGSVAAAELRQKFDHILVDEFQDINPLQAALLEAVRSEVKHRGRGNLFVVGDVKQSIYGFRLAEPRLFLEREMRLAAVGTHRAVVHLQNNFRSDPALLRSLNTLFERLLTPPVAGIDYAAGHALHPPEGGEGDGAGRVEFHVVLTDTAEEDSEEENEETRSQARPKPPELSDVEREALMVAERIGHLMAEGRMIPRKNAPPRPLQYKDIAILLRGVRHRAHLFARALAEKNIPVHADLSTGYFEAEEVQQTLALLQLLDNPCQDLPLVTVLLSPYGRFSHDDLARLRLAAPDRRTTPFHRAAAQFLEAPPADDPAADELAERLRAFFATLDGYRARARTIPLHEALAGIYQDSRFLTYVSGLPAPQQRVANLQALHQRASQFAGFRKQGLHRFLRFIERLQEADGDFGEAPVLSEAADVVRIMSIHKSKGLEFPVVFASSLGVQFNIPRASPVLVHRDRYVGLPVADLDRNRFLQTPASVNILTESRRTSRAEELRLFYVAATRARNLLVLTGALQESRYTSLRQEGSYYPGALPEDVQLRARTYLDYLVPLLAQPAVAQELTFQEHRPAAHPVDGLPAGGGAMREMLLRRRPLAEAPAGHPVVADLVRRLTYLYPQQALTTLPALYRVTELKKLTPLPPPEELPPAAPPAPPPADARPQLAPRWLYDPAAPRVATPENDPKARGIATHRVLELVDFGRASGAGELREQIAAMVRKNLLSEAEANLVQLQDLEWFLSSGIGTRLRAADPAAIRREVPFVYALPPAQLLNRPELTDVSPADYPQIRGTIDVLLLTADGAEIIDYKTDKPWLIADHLPGYRQQMGYYAQAVGQLLGRPVRRATLVFLAARRLEVIECENPPAIG